MLKKNKFKGCGFKLLKLLLILFISSLLYGIICIWIMPPITLTQIANSFGYGLKRNYVSWNKISPNVKLAAMAGEDQLFPDHSGFDWKSIEKSMAKKPSKKNKVRGAGASTITQQTAKNVFLWQGGGVFKYVRKVPEFYFTKMIEWTWGKKRILEVYLNVVEMGPGVFGIQAASQYYFHKDAKDLSQREAAMIIACLPNPKKFTVVPMSRFVAFKTNWILRQMNNIAGDEDVQALMK